VCGPQCPSSGRLSLAQGLKTRQNDLGWTVVPAPSVLFPAPWSWILKIAGIQMDIVWESLEGNLTRARKWLELAARRGARLAVPPEMFATGFSMDLDRTSPWALQIEAFLRDTATELGLTLVGGLADRAEDGGHPRGRNWAVAFTPQGQCVARYQKIHPFSFGSEHEHFRGGESLASFAVGNLAVTPFICYDLRFPELFRAAAIRSDLMVVIANWPSARREAWRGLLTARAIENQCFVLGVNRVGEGGGLHYSGDSMLLDPLGQTLEAICDREGLVLGEVSPTEVAETRAQFPFLVDRRPEVYERL